MLQVDTHYDEVIMIKTYGLQKQKRRKNKMIRGKKIYKKKKKKFLKQRPRKTKLHDECQKITYTRKKKRLNELFFLDNQRTVANCNKKQQILLYFFFNKNMVITKKR